MYEDGLVQRELDTRCKIHILILKSKAVAVVTLLLSLSSYSYFQQLKKSAPEIQTRPEYKDVCGQGAPRTATTIPLPWSTISEDNFPYYD